MAHFTIQLPDNSGWDVASGQVLKKTVFVGFFGKKKTGDVRRGYIITSKSTPKQYRFLKTSEGNWTDKNEAGFEAGNDETSLLIKKRIDEFERIL